MSNYIALTKVEMKNYWRLLTRNMGVGNRRRMMIPLLLLLVFSFGVMGFQLANAVYQGFEPLGMPELTITVLYLGASLMVLLLSFSALINLFYYSKNTGFLLTLPITENTIILSRLSVQYIYSWIMSMALVLPALITFFSRGHMTLIGLVGGVLAVFLVPMIPLLVSALLVMAFMGALGRFLNRRIVTVFVNIMLFVVIIGLQIVVTRQSMESDFLVKLFLSGNGLLYYLGLQFPPSIWATQMVNGSISALLYFVVLNMALIVAVNFLIRPMVRQSLRQYNQGETKVITKRADYGGSSVRRALVRRNLLIVVKTPAFFLNFMILALLPFLMVGVNMLNGAGSLAEIQGMITKLAQPQVRPLLTLIAGGVLMMPALMGTLSATAITREGKYFWQSKSLPISAREDIQARLISCAYIIALSIMVTLPLLLWILPLGISDILWAFVLIIPAIYAMLTIDMIIDISKPILNWTSPTQAIKNNLNILVALAWRIAVGILAYGVIKVLGAAVTLSSLKYVLVGIFIIAAGAGHLLLQKSIAKYAKIEVR